MITLLEISDALNSITDRFEFDNWIDENKSLLLDFFYKKNGADFNRINFEDFFFKIFLSSPVYREFDSTKINTDNFNFFLTLIAVACEKLALVGSNHLLISIIGNLPENANKYRLKALNEFTMVDDFRTSYFEKLPLILSLLDKSRTEFEEGNIRQILDVVINFYVKAKDTFTKNNLPNKIERLKELLTDQTLIEKFPFLQNPVVVDLINDKDTFSLLLNNYTRDCLEPSTIIRELFTQINTDYFNHPNINHGDDDLWGHSKKYILDNILVRGRGDYTKNSGVITTDDKVILYCFYNMKKHFFTSYGVYQRVINSLRVFFDSHQFTPTFIDLGCGPMTSGLAMVDLLYSEKNEPIDLHYIGIDISTAMTNKCKYFEKTEFFSENCTFNYYNHWNDIKFHQIYSRGINSPIIFNASYLFASESVNPQNLATTVNLFAKNFKNVFFVFQNPNRLDRNVKYVEFKSYLNYVPLVEDQEVIQYKAASNISQEEVYYEILKILPL